MDEKGKEVLETSEKDSVDSPKDTEKSENVGSKEIYSSAEVVETLTAIDKKMDFMCNSMILISVGIGVIVGVLCTNILSRYVRS